MKLSEYLSFHRRNVTPETKVSERNIRSSITNPIYAQSVREMVTNPLSIKPHDLGYANGPLAEHMQPFDKMYSSKLDNFNAAKTLSVETKQKLNKLRDEYEKGKNEKGKNKPDGKPAGEN